MIAITVTIILIGKPMTATVIPLPVCKLVILEQCIIV